jgi:hypothetical protein
VSDDLRAQQDDHHRRRLHHRGERQHQRAIHVWHQGHRDGRRLLAASFPVSFSLVIYFPYFFFSREMHVFPDCELSLTAMIAGY